MKGRRFFYHGDVNIEHGGFFYAVDTVKWGYSDVLSVVPCSDAGGPNNCFWIERLTVNIPDGAKLDDILRTCGYKDNPHREEFEAMTFAQQTHSIIRACVMAGNYDQHSSEMIRIGGPDPFHRNSNDPEWAPETQYSPLISLRRLAREKCRDL